MRGKRPILLVEDDTVDAMTVQRALKEIHVANRVEVVGNGEEALKYLRDENNEKPDIILLDLNMPKMNGIEFLKILKADEALKKIPVVVMTTSRAEQDIVESFRLGAAGYMVKSIDYKKFVETIMAIDLCLSSSELSD
ncbi:MAG: response regulator [Thermodesulfovibrionia bacterium]|nr:response regulator [Thermodesulfovibrionia bacterium]